MKRLILSISLLALAAVLLTACASTVGPQANGAKAGVVSGTSLDTSYTNALPARNQLLLGTLKLDEGTHPLSDAQVAVLLPLWQGVRGTMNSGAAAQAESDALLKQIEAALTADQRADIRGWKLTQADLQAWATSQGISAGTGNASGGGAGSGVPGSGQTLTTEQRATRQAERGGGADAGGLSKALIDAVINALANKQAD